MNKKLVDKILNPQVFALFYLSWLAVNMLQVVNPMAFTRVFLAVFAVWGAAVAVRCYLFSKDSWGWKYMPLLLVFLAVCLVMELVNFQYGGLSSIIELCFFALCIVVLYAQYRAEENVYNDLLKKVTAALGLIISLSMLVSLWMFVNMYSETIETRGGAQIVIGFTQNRLSGLFSSSNVGGLFAVILAWCALATLYLRRGEKRWGLWVAAAGVEMLLSLAYISVALSRGTYLAGFAFVAAFLMMRPAFAFEQKWKTWRQLLFRLASVAVAVAVIAGLISLLNLCLCSAMETVYEYKLAHGVHGEELEAMQELLDKAWQGFDGRTEAGRTDIDITNKRMDIWTNHLQLLEGSKLLTGVNDPYVYYEKLTAAGALFTEQQEVYINWAKGNMHNGFIQILVNCGGIALVLMLAFLAVCVAKCFGCYIGGFKANTGFSDLRYTLFSLCTPMVVCILVNNVVETNFVLMGANFFQALFWFVAGICVLCVKGRK